ncbi:nuclear transport factor 2 family protein [Aliiglaciecola sp. SL4]|uniref:nuclear transport factor 2 family protein n=1 Tax=Aliiglaciecola sp. SL4 TaxID=3239806 RepID=UPI00355B3AE9
MNKWIVMSITLLWSFGSIAETDVTELGNEYFSAWVATQSPDASNRDLEHYLSFLKSAVAHQHLPYDSDDSRSPDGKESTRKGMRFYLGTHLAYTADLKQIIPAHNAVVITYTTSSRGIHSQTNELIELHY